LVAEHTEANDIMDESDCQVSETDVLFDFVNHVVIVREKKSREDVGLLAADNISLLTQNGPERIGTIQVGLSKAGMMSSMRAAKLRAIWLAAAVIFLAIMATYIIVKLMFRPINRLAVAAGKVSRGDFDSKVIVRSRDEIGDLAESFNTMTGDLKKSNDSLQYRLQLEKLITSISAKFINLAIDEIDQEIENALHSIGEFIGTEGNYVFIFSRDGSGIEEIYKWCAESTDLKLDRFKEFPAEDFSWWIKQISKLETINIPNVSELTPEAGTAKESLLEQGIRSLVITPMVYGGALVGSLIFASVKEEKAWLEQDIVILKMVGGIFVNALKRKQTEEALQHRLEVEEQMTKELEEKTEELSRSNGELNSFVYTVSHDLKAPVVTLQGFSSILLSDYGDQLDDSGRMYIERIQKNSERMGMLINDLLELSRIGRVLGQEEMINVSDIISGIKDDLTSLLEEKGTKLVLRNGMPTVRCDRTRLHQVFTNLISNATKFMGDDNKEPIIEVGYGEENGHYEFYVKDNGIGIAKEYQDKIFQIFQRLDDVKAEGTGVGLAIVKKIVNAHNGKIDIESSPDQGTTVRVLLPIAEIAEDEEE